MKIIKKICSKWYSIYRNNFTKKLVKRGAKIGKHTKIYDPIHSVIDTTRPWLLTIGDYTLITRGVVILTHDYSLSTLRRVYGDYIGEGQETVIGDNCFIGMNSIILMGTHIGNNVIVGAGSVVHGSIPDNVVVAGNPARIICSLDEHYKNRFNKTKKEALFCAAQAEKRLGRKVQPSDLGNFKFLFCPRDKDIVKRYGFSFDVSGDDSEELEKAFYNSVPVWSNFEELIDEMHDNNFRGVEK